MPARGIHHIDLAVTDVERSLAFYRELPGYYELFVFDPDGIRVEVACASSA
jgi:predicted enzyme related to lactoylglutathione lyase